MLDIALCIQQLLQKKILPETESEQAKNYKR